MNYNPNIHHRESIRLKDYDYSKEGMYFITHIGSPLQKLFKPVGVDLRVYP